MEKYLFIYRNIVVGGCELLIEKLANQLVNFDKKVCIYCESIDNEMRMRFASNEIDLVMVNDWKNASEFYCKYDSSCELRIITFYWSDFVRFYSDKRYKKKTLLYAVHYKALSVGREIKMKPIRKVARELAKHILSGLLKSRHVIVMDEQTIDFSQKYYNSKLQAKDKDFKILRIPVDTDGIDMATIPKKQLNSNDINLLAIARAEFPFKGYLLGLIDYMAKANIQNLKLDIISYGDGIEQLTERINKLPEEKKIKVVLHGKKDFDELKQYFVNATVYIGMGTTVLDAALMGVITIPVAAYTNDLIVDKFFHDDYRVLAVENGDVNKINLLIQEIVGLNDEEYKIVAKKSQKLVVDHYSSHAIAGKLITLFDDIICDVPKFGVKLFSRYYWFRIK